MSEPTTQAGRDLARRHQWCDPMNDTEAAILAIEAEAAEAAVTHCASLEHAAQAAALSEREAEPMTPFDVALPLIRDAFEKAVRKHAPMHSAHEGSSVIREEFEELWELVRTDTGAGPEAVKEAAQVGAMAARYLIDVCGVHVAALAETPEAAT